MSMRGEKRTEFPQSIRKAALPPASIVRGRLSYCPSTGVFTWRTSEGPNSAIGMTAGFSSRKGYRKIKLHGGCFAAHRLAWIYMTGDDPGSRYVDHWNGKTDDNRWSNLRLASHGQNKANSRLHRNNTTGLKGVSPVTGSPRWQARIRKDRKLIYLGVYATKEEAHAAYKKAAKEHFGEFANGGYGQ
jgi:hypothetical protein